MPESPGEPALSSDAQKTTNTAIAHNGVQTLGPTEQEGVTRAKEDSKNEKQEQDERAMM